MNDLLKGLKVVELAGVLAGPATGMFFAELGARVIKVENPHRGGDVTRSWKLASENPDSPYSAYFASVNIGKEFVFCDLKNPKDRERINEELKDTDIVITNFKAGDEETLGLTYSDLRKLNPKIIQGRITAYNGNDTRPGYDLVMQAEAGFMSMNGTPDSGPLKMPVAFIDLFAAHQLKEGLLLALIKRMKDDKGSCVTVSLYNAALASLANQASNFLMTGYVPGLQGSLHPNIAPYGEILLSSDGKRIVLAVGNDRQFASLCKVLKLDDLITDPRYQSNRNRVRERGSLGTCLAAAALKFSSSELILQLNEHEIPCGAIRNLAEVLSDEAGKNKLLREFREGVELLSISGIAFNMKS